MKQVRENKFLVILFISLMFLFFFQMLTDFVAAIYAYCLLTTGLNLSVVAILFLLSPVLLIVFGQRTPPLLIVLFGELALLFRSLEVSASPSYKIILAGCGVGCFLLFFPSYLHFIKDSNRNTKGGTLGLGFALAVLLAIGFKTINSSLDITGVGPQLWIGWVLAGFTFLIMPYVLLGGGHLAKSRNRQIFGKKSERPSVFLPAWGIFSVVGMVYFFIGSPAVISRWTEGSYSQVIAVQVLAIAFFGIYSLLLHNPDSPLAKPILVLWNLLFLMAVVGLIVRLQVPFPNQEVLYPVYADKPGLETRILLYLILILSPVLFVDLSIFTAQVIKTSVSVGRVGFGFFLAALLFLCLIFFHIFTTVYDYIPLIGPLFRDKFWLVHLLVGLGLLFSVLFSRDELTRDRGVLFSTNDRFLLLLVLAGAVGLNFAAIHVATPNPETAAPQSSLRVMSFNIQQGYDKRGVQSFYEQLEVIKAIDPDIVGLQETDSTRIAGGNTDLVRFFADRLQMHSYYGPNPVTGTFGIALLSKYPILNPQTFYMYSVGEQTATIEAQVRIGDTLLNVFVTHLGNDGDMVQQQAILRQVQGKNRVLVLGDFNFTPETPQYRLTTQTLIDSWEVMKLQGGVDSGLGSENSDRDRIDYIFASPDLKPLSSRFLFGDISDHPALVSSFSLR